MERRLYYIPTGHASSDVNIGGNRRAAQALDSYTSRLFKGIEQFVGSLGDAEVATSIVAVDGYEQKTVNTLSIRGVESFVASLKQMGHTRQTTPQEFVLGDLMARGATLVSVENSGLIKQSRQIIAAMNSPRSDEEFEKLRSRLEGLNSQRDDSMVSTVNKMHKPLNTWLLFWGAAHDARAKLTKRGIEVVVPQEIFSYLKEEDFQRVPYLTRFRAL